MEVEEIIKEAVSVIRRYVPEEYKIFLFGSQAEKKAASGFDIDIGIFGPEKIPQRTFRRIKNEIDAIPTLRKIDVVDFNAVDKEFKENALSKAKEVETPMSAKQIWQA